VINNNPFSFSATAVVVVSMGVQLDAAQTGLTEIEEFNFSDLDLVDHVRDALKSVSLGDCDKYNELIGLLYCDERLNLDKVALLVTVLKALCGAVCYIDVVHHHKLLACIRGMSLWNYGTDVMDVLVKLVVSLAASSGKDIDLWLGMLVSNFTAPYFPYLTAKKNQVLHHVHIALGDITKLIPLAPSKLEQLIKERMPNIYSTESLLVNYVENMLILESGDIGELVGKTMLVEVMNRLVDLDLEIGWDDFTFDESHKGIFDMELEDVEKEPYSSELDIHKGQMGFSSQKCLWGNDVAKKMDSLMVIIFEHLKSCRRTTRWTVVIETLLESFDCTVLKSYKPKFAQFVMFYACSLDPENCGERFVSRLADIFAVDPSCENRIIAVAYIASYLSRAKFLSGTYVANVLQSLVVWCNNYCKEHGNDINLQLRKVFYSACQAVIYVLCFRMKSMVGIPRLRSQLDHMPIESILNHSLNPLKACLPSIVEEFLAQAKSARMFSLSDTFVNNILDSEPSRAFTGLERLDMFFPFDPYLLNKSDIYIRPNFVYWSMVTPICEDDDEDEYDEDDVEDHEIGQNGGVAMSSDEEDVDVDLNKMSITPQNSLKNGFKGTLRGRMQMPSRIRPSMSPESL
jgi:RNA polymerase I-specific transcription initiation factor RRN3